MTGTFTSATAVAPLGDERWSADLASGWDILGNTHGGYMLATAARALTAETHRRDPVTITGHFLTPGRCGPVSIEAATIRAGRRFTTATATMRSDDGRPLLAVLATLGDVDEGEGPELVDAEPPHMPSPEECLLLVGGEPLPPAFSDQVEMRLHPEDGGFYDGRASGTARMRGWFRLLDGEPIDTIALLCAVDAFPPTSFNARLPIGWTPTLELTVHVRARPEPGWLRCSFRTRFVTGGFLEADGEIWDTSGRLVAQSRQLALLARG